MAEIFGELADVLAALEDNPFRVPVEVGEDRTWGLRRTPEETLLEGHVTRMTGKLRVVTVASGSLPGLALKGALVIDGDSFTVLDFRMIGTGAMTRIYYRETP